MVPVRGYPKLARNLRCIISPIGAVNRECDRRRFDEITDGNSDLQRVDDPNRVGSHRAELGELDWRQLGEDPAVHPALLLDEVQRLGESEIPLVLLGILEFTVAVVYLIPRTSILGAILLTGFLGGAEAIPRYA